MFIGEICIKNFNIYACVAVILIGASISFAGLYTGSLSALDGGMISDGQTWALPSGFQVSWQVEQTDAQTWHYKYTFSNEIGGDLSMLVSHMIISLSDNIEESDLFNFGTDIDDIELGEFGPHTSNPGFPVNETIFGIKLNMANNQLVAEFDSTRQPMWGDFYAKGGGQPKNFAYNSNLGTEVSNLHAFDQTPIDFQGNELSKILVPNSVPDPATLFLLGFGSMIFCKRKA